MTEKETKQVLAILKAAYPNSFRGMTKEEALGTVTVWHMQFLDMPADIVLMAIHKLIGTNKFPPSVCEVKDKICSLHWEAYEVIAAANRLPDTEIAQYRRIYEATKEYKQASFAEITLSKMLQAATIDDRRKIGAGGDSGA